MKKKDKKRSAYAIHGKSCDICHEGRGGERARRIGNKKKARKEEV